MIILGWLFCGILGYCLMIYSIRKECDMTIGTLITLLWSISLGPIILTFGIVYQFIVFLEWIHNKLEKISWWNKKIL